MKIEILYFSGCPNYLPAVDRVREVLRQEGVDGDVVGIEVANAAAAQQMGFLGSPTIRVDGQDVEREARQADTFGFTCRTYIDAGRRCGVPPREWIQTAVRELRK
jgi:hypothetical protein